MIGSFVAADSLSQGDVVAFDYERADCHHDKVVVEVERVRDCYIEPVRSYGRNRGPYFQRGRFLLYGLNTLANGRRCYYTNYMSRPFRYNAFGRFLLKMGKIR